MVEFKKKVLENKTQRLGVVQMSEVQSKEEEWKN